MNQRTKPFAEIEVKIGVKLYRFEFKATYRLFAVMILMVLKAFYWLYWGGG